MGFIKFLGTAGARFVVMRQLRASGGIWLQFKSTSILIDPGPGSIVKCNTSKPKLDPSGLDAIILTHKHLDHSGDINVMIEAMTEGGLKKKGILFVPPDALGKDGIVFSYLEQSVEKITILGKGKFSVGDICFEVPTANIHSVITHGLKFHVDGDIISFVSDTKYFDDLINIYKDSTILVLNVVFYQRRDEFQHLCLEEAIKIIKEIRPKRAILTHFGMSMLRQKPHLLEQKVRENFARESFDVEIKFAYDGLSLEIPTGVHRA